MLIYYSPLLNIAFFNKTYGIVAARSLDELDPRSVQAYKVGRYLRDHTKIDTAVVIFGQGYSSEIGFQAQRKSMTVPPWFTEYHQLWLNPEAYLGGLKLSAIVVCPTNNEFPTIADIQVRMAKEPTWVHVSVNDCEILLSPNMDFSSNG